MHILALTYEPPETPINGYRLRCYNILKRLARDNSITLISLHREVEPQVKVATEMIDLHERLTLQRRTTTRVRALRNAFSLQPLHVSTLPLTKLAGLMRELVGTRSVDLVWANYDYFAPAIPFRELRRNGGMAVVDQHQLQSASWRTVQENHPSAATRAYATYARWKTARFERRWYPQFDLCFSCTQEETAATTRIAEPTPVAYAPNGVDTAEFRPPARPSEGRRIVLTGGDGRHNVDAIQHFVDDIMPLVLEQEPEAELEVIGNVNRAALKGSENWRAVRLTGPVPDVRAHLADGVVSIAPHRMGTGSKLKVLEAMAVGLPVVGSPNGLAGLEVQPGVDVLLADGPAGFAQAIVKLLRDPARRRRIGAAARATVERLYDWDHIVDGINNEMASLLASTRNGATAHDKRG